MSIFQRYPVVKRKEKSTKTIRHFLSMKDFEGHFIEQRWLNLSVFYLIILCYFPSTFAAIYHYGYSLLSFSSCSFALIQSHSALYSCWPLQKLLSASLIPLFAGLHLIFCNYWTGPHLHYVFSSEERHNGGEQRKKSWWSLK